eukprot:gene13179-biopygen3525
MTLETVDDFPIESPGDVTAISHGCTSLKLCFRTDPTDADTVVALAAPSDPGSQKGQADEDTRVSLAHLATPLDELSEAQKRSLEILEKARAQSPCKSSKRNPQVSPEAAMQVARQGSWRYLLGGGEELAMAAARE